MMRPRITIHKGIRMLVAVDIGNTNIVLGFLDGDDIIGTYRITTKSNHTSDEYGLMITQFLALSGLRPSDIDDVIIASVVPKVMHSFRASIIKFLNINPMVVGPGIKTGINIRIDDPKSLGSDCLADCVGAYYTYGGPVLVADFGTATTFNYVNDEGVIRGGLVGRDGPAARGGNHQAEIHSRHRHEDRDAGRTLLQLPRRHRTHDPAVPHGAGRAVHRRGDRRPGPRVQG